MHQVLLHLEMVVVPLLVALQFGVLGDLILEFVSDVEPYQVRLLLQLLKSPDHVLSPFGGSCADGGQSSASVDSLGRPQIPRIAKNTLAGESSRVPRRHGGASPQARGLGTLLAE